MTLFMFVYRPFILTRKSSRVWKTFNALIYRYMYNRIQFIEYNLYNNYFEMHTLIKRYINNTYRI